jgi:hypothetical protein
MAFGILGIIIGILLILFGGYLVIFFPSAAHTQPPSMTTGAIVLGFLCVVVGILLLVF